MGSIDLFADFNDEDDARANGYDEEDDGAGGPVRFTADGDPAADGDDEGNKEAVSADIKVVRAKRKVATLNVVRLKGPRGIVAVDDFFKNMKFKGRGYEKQDLDDVLKRMEHWAHRFVAYSSSL